MCVQVFAGERAQRSCLTAPSVAASCRIWLPGLACHTGHNVQADCIVIGGGGEDNSMKEMMPGRSSRKPGKIMKYSDTHSPFSAPKTFIECAQIRVDKVSSVSRIYSVRPLQITAFFSLIQTNLNMAMAQFLSMMNIHFHSFIINNILLKMCPHQVFPHFSHIDARAEEEE